jgi:hypothetical protein
MSVVIDGTTGVSGVSGSASTPALQGEDSNTGVFFPAADTVAVATGGSERLRVDSSGNVGIGTSSPGAALEVSGETRIYPSSGAANLRFGSGGSEKAKLAVDTSSNMIFETANSERLRIDASGNVGIGASPAADYKLDVNGAFTVGGTYNTGTSTNGGGVNIGFDTTNGGKIESLNPAVSWYPLTIGSSETKFTTLGLERVSITSTGDLRFNSGYGSVATAYGCRAWVNFNGQGTVAIRASGNVSSVTDLGTGNYRVNLATAMPDANYAAVTGGQNDQGNNGYIVLTSGGMTASSVQVMSRREAGFGDGSLICVSIFR